MHNLANKSIYTLRHMPTPNYYVDFALSSVLQTAKAEVRTNDAQTLDSGQTIKRVEQFSIGGHKIQMRQIQMGTNSGVAWVRCRGIAWVRCRA